MFNVDGYRLEIKLDPALFFAWKKLAKQNGTVPWCATMQGDSIIHLNIPLVKIHHLDSAVEDQESLFLAADRLGLPHGSFGSNAMLAAKVKMKTDMKSQDVFFSFPRALDPTIFAKKKGEFTGKLEVIETYVATKTKATLSWFVAVLDSAQRLEEPEEDTSNVRDAYDDDLMDAWERANTVPDPMDADEAKSMS